MDAARRPRRLIAPMIAVLVLGVACDGGPTASEEPEPSNQPSPSPSPEVSPLVGEWMRVTTCQEMVAALEDAGLGEQAPQTVAGNGLVPGTPEQLAKKADICEGSTPREHSHFFTEWGTFGSLDWKGQQVDDGTYEMVDDQTFTIGDATFHFEVVGDTITFDPVLEECTHDCNWMVAVAFPGHTWQRVGDGQA